MDLDPRFRRGAVARRFSWLILAAFGWVLSAPACSPSNDSVVVPGTGGSGGTVDASSDRAATGGGVAMGGGGTAGAPRGGGGSAGTGGGTGGSLVPPEGGAEASPSDAAADVVVYVCPDGGSPTMDTDFDGVPDCVDGCPLDFGKQAPGICGCGFSDVTDADNDGTIDCLDGCPNDANKLAPGVCGCGLSDTLDSDTDGVVDCLDGCPHNHDRQVAGPCGCLDITDPLCLAHRYSFNDPPGSTTAADTGNAPTLANGTIFNTTIPAGDAGADGGSSGSVVLAGVATDQYVALPQGVISALGDSATFETWLTWNSINQALWQRVFDFGSSDNGPNQGTGITYLFLTPRASSGFTRIAFSLNSFGGNEDLLDNTTATPIGAMTHLAVVVDGAAHNMKLYQNGVVAPANSTGVSLRAAYSLSKLNDINNWIGRSQYVNDEEFAGTIFEFRIYSRAMPPEQIAANFAAGPNALPAVVDAGTPPPPPDAAAEAAPDAAADASGQ